MRLSSQCNVAVLFKKIIYIIEEGQERMREKKEQKKKGENKACRSVKKQRAVNDNDIFTQQTVPNFCNRIIELP